MITLIVIALSIGLPVLAIAARVAGPVLGATIGVLLAPIVMGAVFIKARRRARELRSRIA
jgi:hypothetical protein